MGKIKEDRDITRIIHYLCLMMDELEDKTATETPVRMADLNELQDKAMKLAKMAHELKAFSR